MGRKDEIKAVRDRIAAFVREYQEAHETPPTIREICQHTGIRSTASMRLHLEALVESGNLCAHEEKRARRFYAPMGSSELTVPQTLAQMRLQMLAGEDVFSAIRMTILESLPTEVQTVYHALQVRPRHASGLADDTHLPMSTVQTALRRMVALGLVGEAKRVYVEGRHQRLFAVTRDEVVSSHDENRGEA